MGEVPAEETSLARLERASRELEQLAAEAAIGARTMGADVGARNRIELVKQRLKIALDELEGFSYLPGDITEE